MNNINFNRKSKDLTIITLKSDSAQHESAMSIGFNDAALKDIIKIIKKELTKETPDVKKAKRSRRK